MVDAARHPRIELMTLTQVKSCTGYVGNFRVTLEKMPRFVEDSCNACRECLDVCPVRVPNELDLGLAPRRAIYQPFSQAVPSTFLIDERSCIHCYRCVDACEKGAVNFSQKPREIEAEVGSIVLATGFDPFDAEALTELGYGRYPDVVTSLELERLLDPSGPTQGELIRPSDFSRPKRIGFIQCAGSRSTKHNEYCSGYCCMASLKTALYIKDKYPEAEVAIFYLDIRTPAKGYEEFFRRVREAGVTFIQGKPSEVAARAGESSLSICAEDRSLGRHLEWEADLAVLAVGAVPSAGAKELSSRLLVSLDEHGFFREHHPKLRPMDSPTEGVFFAGAGCGPKDIPYSVAQGSAAAARASRILMSESLVMEPIVACADEELCRNAESRCGICAKRCPFGAIVAEPGEPARVISAKCMGCGTCVAECPAGAITQAHFTDLQIFAQIRSYLRERPEDKILAFMCWWCSYPGADNAGVNHLQYAASSRGIRVMCAGRIKRDFVLEAFRQGAGLVLVSGCHPQDCHYLTGQHWAERRMKGMASRLEKMGISPQRFRVEWISAAEGRKYARVINEMDRTLHELGAVRIRGENEAAGPELAKRLAHVPDIIGGQGRRESS
jgi:heterodisulfide reductase subunit A